MSDSSDYLPISDAPTADSMSVGEDSALAYTISRRHPIEEVPSQIGGYKIVRWIGSGGMGDVYLAEHVRMQRVVALKMLPIDRISKELAVERFYDEVRAASRLLHPNIVTAFDAGEFEGIHYLAMEFVDGMTLTKIVAVNGPVSIGEAASIIRQAASGLLHAHRAGIVHRDVKPGNLMRASDGTIKVLDLGLARIAAIEMNEGESEHQGVVSEKGKLVGTLPFMSPEQLEDPDSADPRSDIYSLGATFYFLLTASPPFVGEYLDQVYGHRHGEVPDLMQARDDADLNLANILRRMMAKSPDQRYASLDEVIDDLEPYASANQAPMWLADFSLRQPGSDASTAQGSGSTSGVASRVLAIDFGMNYSATAEASPFGGVRSTWPGGEPNTLFRMAIASDNGELRYGTDAISLRAEQPHSLVHCLQMYIGKQVVDRKIAGRQCPPEVLMAMLMRKIYRQVWQDQKQPLATAITVPASYDQFHRRSILQAAKIAGLSSVRLVDRSVAGVQSLWLDQEVALSARSLSSDSALDLQTTGEQTILFVGVTGQATEAAVIRRDTSRVHQLSTGGHWHGGTMPWLHRFVDLAADAFQTGHGFDPRTHIKTAASLQIGCERAMNSMLLMPSATVKVQKDGQTKSVEIHRQDWLRGCVDLISTIRKAIKRACKDASIGMDAIDNCVTLGPILRIAIVRDSVLRGLGDGVQYDSIDRNHVARGAAAVLAAELPGRGDVMTPPAGVTSQTIGIVVEDAKSRRRILPIIPKGTALPARTNRRLSVGPDRDRMTVSLVESSGEDYQDWQSLGRHEIPIEESATKRSRTIGFEINVNGLLTVRAQSPGTPASVKLPILPPPTMLEEDILEWSKWLQSLD